MFDLGFAELLIVGIVALIVVGPKDLPGMFRTLGKFTARIRHMARDFQRAMEEAADESGVKKTAADLKKMTSPARMGMDKLKEASGVADWDATKPSSKSTGPETEKLREERAQKAKETREASKKTADDETT